MYGMDGFSVDQNGDILKSDIYCHDQVNTATEYGSLIDNGYVIFNDTDAQGDEEVGVMQKLLMVVTIQLQ